MSDILPQTYIDLQVNFIVYTYRLTDCKVIPRTISEQHYLCIKNSSALNSVSVLLLGFRIVQK